MKKALSSSDLLAKKYELIKWDGEWFDNFDQPEASGLWFVSGNSTNGKTSFLLQLAKELAKYDRVLYNSLEEKDAKTMQKAWQRHQMGDCIRKVQLIWERREELISRLEKRQSPRFIIVDSFQYMKMTFDQTIELKERFPNKLFIYNSQMEGSKPIGKSAVRVQYDADLKIWIEGFKAFSKGRYMGLSHTEGLTIWEEGAEKYWGQKQQDK